MKEVQFKVQSEAGNGISQAESPLKVAYKKINKDFVSLGQKPFFIEEAYQKMVSGSIPDLSKLQGLLDEIKISDSPLSAIQFLPALRKFELNNLKEIDRFLDNPETNHVLVQNEFIKMVLIRWEPGTSSDIHGHATGGCVFKVLSGTIEELRLSTNKKQKLLAKGIYSQDHIAYIDDVMGYHQVGNPFDKPAVTLHMYTPGFKK